MQLLGVYTYSFANCAFAKVGMTSGNLYSRVAEHKGRSCRTGQLLLHPPHLAAHTDSKQGNVPASKSNFEVGF
jgi:hypothetical protein